MTAIKLVGKSRNRLTQAQMFQLCSYLEKNPDLKTSSNATVVSLAAKNVTGATISEKHIDNARKVLGNGWVLPKVKKPMGRKPGTKNKTSQGLPQILLCLDLIMAHLGIAQPQSQQEAQPNNGTDLP